MKPLLSAAIKPLFSYKANKAIIFIALALLVLTFVYASSFSDSSQLDFNNGTYANTTHNGSAVILSGTNLSGTYTSRIFDAADSARWNNLSYDYSLQTAGYIFVVDSQADVWKSSNSGINWTLVKENYKGSGSTADDLDVDSLNNFYILDSQDLWKSNDSGVTWIKVNDDFNGADTNAGTVMRIDSNNNIYIIDSSEDVYKSGNNRTNFSLLASNFNGANGNVYGIDVDNTNSIFVVDSQADVWKSSNSGINWTLVKDNYKGSGSTADDLDVDSLNNLYILDSQDLWKSNDSGVTWIKVNDDFNGAGNNEAGKQMIIDENNIYIIDSSEDVYKSGNNGANFSLLASNFNGANGDIYGATYFNASTNLTFQARNCSQPDCSDGIWQDVNLSNMNLTGRYFQYKSYFSRNDISITPALTNLSVEYSIVCTPNIMNTSWSSWANISCLPGDIMNQTRNLTQYDSNLCGEISNTTFTEYRVTESCDYCTPNLANTSWSSWANISCLSNDTMNQSRTLVQYDSNFCGEISNETFAEFRATEYCNFSAPDTAVPSIISSSPSAGASLSAGTTSYNISLTTDEIALCRYNTSNVTWENMSQMNFTNSTNHSILAEGLSNGNSYNYYFLCEDDESPANRMNSSYALQFSISSPGSSGGGGGGGGGGSSTTIKKTEAPEPPKTEEPKCSESWSCSEWYECASGVQARTCKDVNNCGTSASKPKESQKCGAKKEELSGENLKEDSSITGQAIKVLPYQSPKTQYLIPTILFFVAFIALTSVKKTRMAKKTKRLISILDISMMGMVIILFASSVMNNSSAIGSFLADSTIKSIGITNTANTINNITFPVLIAAFILAAISFIMIMIEREHIRRLTEYENHNLKAIHHNHSKSSIIHILKKIYKL